jgi:hypothetical protein
LAKPKKPRPTSYPILAKPSSAPLQLVNPNAARIDVYSDIHMVCVPTDRHESAIRQFGANTIDLEAIAG